MKTITAVLVLVSCQRCFAGGDTNIIALSEWSKPVGSVQGHALRARMIIAQEHSPAHAGPWPETEFNLEFQNVSGAIGSPTQFYFDPSHGLNCELRDAHGKSPSQAGGGSGGGAGASWITLPYDSTVRLRANMYGYGRKPGDGLLLCLDPNTQYWNIETSDTNAYFLSGTFTITTPTNYVAKDFDAARAIWNGTLELPKVKISFKKP